MFEDLNPLKSIKNNQSSFSDYRSIIQFLIRQP